MSADERTVATSPDSAAERLASEIRRLRRKSGLSQVDLAAAAGYTRQYVSQAEIPRRNLPSLDLIRTLDDVLTAEGQLVALREDALVERQGRRVVLRKQQTAGSGASPGPTIASSRGTATATETDSITTRKMVRASAQDARWISSWMAATNAGAHAIQMYRDCLKASSADFLHRPAAEVFSDLDNIRRELFSDIEARRHHPRHDHELLMLLGMTSVVLAHASHLLGHPNEGMTQTRLALQCAEQIDHVELGAWAYGTQALIAEGRGNLHEAISHVRRARQHLARSRIPGSATTQCSLATVEQAQEVLRQTNEVADLDDIGGILEFPAPKASMYAGQVHTLINQPQLAEQHAQSAIDSYLSGEPELRSYGDIALARIDIATARLTARDLTGVHDALTPVFSLPVALRTEHLRPSLTALATALTSKSGKTSVGAIELQQKITAFAVMPCVE
ncbi:helix-turn-helix domain-containing protein [Actinosynnema sp. ALI-1.44]|uniref:helix-turn-helix domain-containing protein n=1 Tax=Actinosynnema sp. ALI-1.44 TaxID=1933779 RepID=UPI00143D2E16|nr:helix-turn-helix transcriptional regulator [Actinosynnema sp. ALI-1.44]